MRVQNSVTGPSGKLDKGTMANQYLVWKLRRAIESVAPDEDPTEIIDPKLTWDEQVGICEERLHITLFPGKEKLKGPDGKVCNGETYCLYCGAHITYNKKSRRFCDNNNRCKMAYYRLMVKERLERQALEQF